MEDEANVFDTGNARLRSYDEQDHFGGPFLDKIETILYRGTPHMLAKHGGLQPDRAACAKRAQIKGWVSPADWAKCDNKKIDPRSRFDDCILKSLTFHKEPTTSIVILDQPIPFPNTTLLTFLESKTPFRGDLFAVNPRDTVLSHPQVHILPLGVHDAVTWTQKLNGIEATVDQRTNLLECRGMKLWAGRLQKLQALQKNGFDCGIDLASPDPKPAFLPSESYISRLLHTKFVASPRGLGPQSYRDWEVLLAGAVPLMDQPPSHFMDLYEGLPIVWITDWTAVTPAFLEAKWVEIQATAAAGGFDMRKAHAPYWYAQLAARMDTVG